MEPEPKESTLHAAPICMLHVAVSRYDLYFNKVEAMLKLSSHAAPHDHMRNGGHVSPGASHDQMHNDGPLSRGCV